MDVIFFEKQEGSLCAQHALNALLQGSYFTAPDLAEIAKRLDVQESQVYGENSQNPDDLNVQEPTSHNMDDSGFFSVQVISEALKIWNLELIPFKSTSIDDALLAQRDPTVASAYICNFREHWFTIRKFAQSQWFNLNSVLKQPERVSNTYLSLLLTQLQNDGYSIFVISGDLPHCPADDVLPFVDFGSLPSRPDTQRGVSSSTSPRAEEHDEELQDALSLSRNELDADDTTLQQALQQSLLEAGGNASLQSEQQERQDEELRMALRMSLMTPEEASREAVAVASQAQNPSAERAAPLTVEELRRRRLEYLERQEKNKQLDSKSP